MNAGDESYGSVRIAEGAGANVVNPLEREAVVTGKSKIFGTTLRRRNSGEPSVEAVHTNGGLIG